jgi:hypothetical protein
MQGPKITRIAVYGSFNTQNEVTAYRWHAQDLREPVDAATPMAGNFCVAYVLGRRVYAFSAVTNSWDVLELDLPEGSSPNVGQSEDTQAFKVVSGSHIYTFNQNVGKWEDLDLNAILDGKSIEKSTLSLENKQ